MTKLIPDNNGLEETTAGASSISAVEVAVGFQLAQAGESIPCDRDEVRLVAEWRSFKVIGEKVCGFGLDSKLGLLDGLETGLFLEGIILLLLLLLLLALLGTSSKQGNFGAGGGGSS